MSNPYDSDFIKHRMAMYPAVVKRWYKSHILSLYLFPVQIWLWPSTLSLTMGLQAAMQTFWSFHCRLLDTASCQKDKSGVFQRNRLEKKQKVPPDQCQQISLQTTLYPKDHAGNKVSYFWSLLVVNSHPSNRNMNVLLIRTTSKQNKLKSEN